MSIASPSGAFAKRNHPAQTHRVSNAGGDIGVGELQDELNRMSKQGRWDEMGELITPDILKEFAVIGEPDTIAGQMKARYGDIVDRTSAAYANIPKDKRLAIIRDLSS